MDELFYKNIGYTKKMILCLKETPEKAVSVIVEVVLARNCPCYIRTLCCFLQTFSIILRYWTRLYISIGTSAIYITLSRCPILAIRHTLSHARMAERQELIS